MPEDDKEPPATEKPPSGDNPGDVDPAARTGAGQAGAKKKKALDPTRYGDWEKNGRCIDF